MDAKNIVLTAIDELFEKQNLNAVERWWDPGYAEHSAAGRPGLSGLRELAASLPPGFQQERMRVLAEGDLVAAHCRYHGIGRTSSSSRTSSS